MITRVSLPNQRARAISTVDNRVAAHAFNLPAWSSVIHVTPWRLDNGRWTRRAFVAERGGVPLPALLVGPSVS